VVGDAQWDMAMCLVGALAAQLTLGGIHNRQLEKMRES